MADEERRQRDISAVSALDLAEIKLLMLGSKEAAEVLQRLLECKDVEKLEDLDGLTIRNLVQ